LLNPFAKSLNGKLDIFEEQLSKGSEEEILRTFNSVSEGAESHVGSLEVQLKNLN